MIKKEGERKWDKKKQKKRSEDMEQREKGGNGKIERKGRERKRE